MQADVVREGTVPRDRGVDAWLQLSSPLDRVEYACEIKQKVSQPLLGSVINQLHRLGKQTGLRPLLISGYLTSNVGDRLIQEGFEFIDTAGNMYLNSSAAYILIRGDRCHVDCQPKCENTSLKVCAPYTSRSRKAPLTAIASGSQELKSVEISIR
jgi:hypothetical protein